MQERSATQEILRYYERLFHDRFGRAPRERDLSPVLARTLLDLAGSIESAVEILDAWFTADRLWPRRSDYRLSNVFGAINRLIATGDVTPRGTAKQQELTRQLAACLVERHLRVVK
jgi:hypothetical protein